MPTFTTLEPITVNVDLPLGSLTLIASERGDTIVTVAPASSSWSGNQRTADEVAVEFRDGHLSVVAPKPWHSFATMGTFGSVNITIELPAGSHVQGSAPVGSLTSQGRLGSCTFRTHAGDIRLDEVGELDARASAGSVTIKRISGTATISTGAGSVRVDEVHADTVIKNSYGESRIGTTTAQLNVNGAHGKIVVDRSSGRTTLKSAHSNIRVKSAQTGEVQAQTSSGSIDIGIPDGTAAWLDVASEHGKIRNRLQHASGPAEHERTVEVRATTRYGNVTVRRP